MKKIKYLSAILALAMLTGCASENVSPSDNGARIVWNYGSADDRGDLHTDGEGRRLFTDFDSMNSALICSKPNCPHTNEKECSAFGMDNHPILYNDKLYFFDVETSLDNGEVTDTTTVYKAEPDGTSRANVCTIEGLYLLNYTRMLITGDTAYFSMDKTGWNDEKTATTGYNEVWFVSYNFSTDTFTRIEKLHEGWCSGIWIYGLFDGKVIFSYSYSDEKVPFLEDASEIDKYITNVFKTYDTKSGEFAELSLPKPLYVGGGYYVYEENGGVKAVSESGKEISLPDFPASGEITIENGRIFNTFEQVCANLSDGKMYKVNYSDELTAYSDGFYILKNLNEYSKIGENDYIGSVI